MLDELRELLPCLGPARDVTEWREHRPVVRDAGGREIHLEDLDPGSTRAHAFDVDGAADRVRPRGRVPDVRHVVRRRRLVAGGQEPGGSILRLDGERLALLNPERRRSRSIEPIG
jgi:hypothetical protein